MSAKVLNSNDPEYIKRKTQALIELNELNELKLKYKKYGGINATVLNSNDHKHVRDITKALIYLKECKLKYKKRSGTIAVVFNYNYDFECMLYKTQLLNELHELYNGHFLLQDS